MTAKERFLGLLSTGQLAALLKITHARLAYILYQIPRERHYTTASFPKRRGGLRELHIPHPALKRLQRRLCTILNEVYGGRAPVHGFVPGRSILTHARQHAGRRHVLNVDLKDFFPSISFQRVRGMLLAKPYALPKPVASWIAQLVSPKDGLPQGAPTSPIISNMICSRLDRDLLKIAAKHRCIYSRYADDITISTSRRQFPEALASEVEYDGVKRLVLGGELTKAIESNWFSVNELKVRLRTKYQHQETTGLTVNEFPNVKREFVRQIRAMLHAIRKFGYPAAQQEYNAKYVHRKKGSRPVSLLYVLRGKLEFLRFIRGVSSPVYLRLAHEMQQLDPDYRKGDPAVKQPPTTGKWDVFITHASEDKEAIVRPLQRASEGAGITCWVDEGEIKWGDSITRHVNQGLANSRFVVVVLSKHSYKKEWPLKELHAALALEIPKAETRVLPLIVGTIEEVEEILRDLPLLKDKLYISWSIGVEKIVEKLAGVLKR